MKTPELKEVQYDFKRCDYCRGTMHLTTVTERKKRTPPPGGTDLNLYNEYVKHLWKCSQCGGTQEVEVSIARIDLEEMGGCRRGQCTATVVTQQVANSVPDMPVRLHTRSSSDEFSYMTDACTECLECKFCHQPLKTRKLLFTMESGTSAYHYYHAACALRKFNICPKCRKPLSFTDKLKGLAQHPGCD